MVLVDWLNLVLILCLINVILKGSGLILITPFRLAEDVVFAALKVCIKESSDMILQCSSMDDDAFQSLVAKHPVSQYN